MKLPELTHATIFTEDEYPQRSDQWIRLRAGLLTASSFSRIITPTGRPAKGETVRALLCELLGSYLRPDEIQWEGNYNTDRGEALEGDARDEFSRIMGFETVQVGFVRRNGLPVGCSPDAFVFNADAGEWSGLEIKSPLAKNHIAYLVDGLLPDKYKAQVHGSLAVTGLKSWYFMSYCPGIRPLILRVERDDYTSKLEEAMIALARQYLAFFNQYASLKDEQSA
ncbi:MAG: YqaJ viral recombinase family protein [Akkermansiaceae bacterium]|nr:YqaJ viral recombinase family protein [Akkermansiaceae bacterium]